MAAAAGEAMVAEGGGIMDEQIDWRMTDEEFETFNRIAANAMRWEDEMASWPNIGEMMPWYVAQAIQNLEKRMTYAMAKEIEAAKRGERNDWLR